MTLSGRLGLLVLAVFLSSCLPKVDDQLPEPPNRPEKDFSQLLKPMASNIAWTEPSASFPRTGAMPFFPVGIFNGRPEIDALIREWFSKHLTAMAEPPLPHLAATGLEVYRFLYLRSFHHPVVVRVQETAEGHVLVVKELDGLGGYEPGKLIVDRQRRLDSAEWAERAAVAKADPVGARAAPAVGVVAARELRSRFPLPRCYCERRLARAHRWAP